MNYQITSDNIEITPSMTELAEKKLVRIQTHLKRHSEDSKIRVVINKGPGDDEFTVKSHITLSGNDLFTVDTDFSVEAALVRAMDSLDLQIEKTKGSDSDWENARELKRYPVDEQI